MSKVWNSLSVLTVGGLPLDYATRSPAVNSGPLILLEGGVLVRAQVEDPLLLPSVPTVDSRQVRIAVHLSTVSIEIKKDSSRHLQSRHDRTDCGDGTPNASR